jgi:hypothetical protein
MLEKKENHILVVPNDKAIEGREICPHMLQPDRCGLCLHEKHYKEISEQIQQSKNRLRGSTK